MDLYAGLLYRRLVYRGDASLGPGPQLPGRGAKMWNLSVEHPPVVGRVTVEKRFLVGTCGMVGKTV